MKIVDLHAPLVEDANEAMPMATLTKDDLTQPLVRRLEKDFATHRTAGVTVGAGPKVARPSLEKLAKWGSRDNECSRCVQNLGLSGYLTCGSFHRS